MFNYYFKKFYSRCEPHSMICPSCKTLMVWNEHKAPAGGWYCPNCGLLIDYK